jgi:glycosyltransferase involved in cell wall biosynthesis
MEKIAIVIPLRNAQTTIQKTLESLTRQTAAFEELVIINDASSDNSGLVVDNFLKANGEWLSEKGINLKIIKHEKSQGLAASYNDGILNSSSSLIVTLHSDIILEKDSLKKLVAPLSKEDSSDVVAAYHSVIHPYEIWEKYNFWQKCFFSRLEEKKFWGLDGKFDCFRRTALEKVGNFDDKKFKNAGEDGDIIFKLKKIGKIVKTDAEIIHLHSMDPNFGIKNIIEKQKQYSESQGILLRMGEIHEIASLPKIFFREILVVMLLVPYVNLISAILIIIYSFYYTKLVYLKEWKNLRVLILPFLNIFLLFVSLFYSIKGFIYGKQKN